MSTNFKVCFSLIVLWFLTLEIVLIEIPIIVRPLSYGRTHSRRLCSNLSRRGFSQMCHDSLRTDFYDSTMTHNGRFENQMANHGQLHSDVEYYENCKHSLEQNNGFVVVNSNDLQHFPESGPFKGPMESRAFEEVFSLLQQQSGVHTSNIYNNDHLVHQSTPSAVPPNHFLPSSAFVTPHLTSWIPPLPSTSPPHVAPGVSPFSQTPDIPSPYIHPFSPTQPPPPFHPYPFQTKPFFYNPTIESMPKVNQCDSDVCGPCQRNNSPVHCLPYHCFDIKYPSVDINGNLNPMLWQQKNFVETSDFIDHTIREQMSGNVFCQRDSHVDANYTSAMVDYLTYLKFANYSELLLEARQLYLLQAYMWQHCHYSAVSDLANLFKSVIDLGLTPYSSSTNLSFGGIQQKLPARRAIHLLLKRRDGAAKHSMNTLRNVKFGSRNVRRVPAVRLSTAGASIRLQPRGNCFGKRTEDRRNCIFRHHLFVAFCWTIVKSECLVRRSIGDKSSNGRTIFNASHFIQWASSSSNGKQEKTQLPLNFKSTIPRIRISIASSNRRNHKKVIHTRSFLNDNPNLFKILINVLFGEGPIKKKSLETKNVLKTSLDVSDTEAGKVQNTTKSTAVNKSPTDEEKLKDQMNLPAQIEKQIRSPEVLEGTSSEPVVVVYESCLRDGNTDHRKGANLLTLHAPSSTQRDGFSRFIRSSRITSLPIKKRIRPDSVLLGCKALSRHHLCDDRQRNRTKGCGIVHCDSGNCKLHFIRIKRLKYFEIKDFCRDNQRTPIENEEWSAGDFFDNIRVVQLHQRSMFCRTPITTKSSYRINRSYNMGQGNTNRGNAMQRRESRPNIILYPSAQKRRRVEYVWLEKNNNAKKTENSKTEAQKPYRDKLFSSSKNLLANNKYHTESIEKQQYGKNNNFWLNNTTDICSTVYVSSDSKSDTGSASTGTSANSCGMSLDFSRTPPCSKSRLHNPTRRASETSCLNNRNSSRMSSIAHIQFPPVKQGSGCMKPKRGSGAPIRKSSLCCDITGEEANSTTTTKHFHGAVHNSQCSCFNYYIEPRARNAPPDLFSTDYAIRNAAFKRLHGECNDVTKSDSTVSPSAVRPLTNSRGRKKEARSVMVTNGVLQQYIELDGTVYFVGPPKEISPKDLEDTKNEDAERDTQNKLVKLDSSVSTAAPTETPSTLSSSRSLESTFTSDTNDEIADSEGMNRQASNVSSSVHQCQRDNLHSFELPAADDFNKCKHNEAADYDELEYSHGKNATTKDKPRMLPDIIKLIPRLKKLPSRILRQRITADKSIKRSSELDSSEMGEGRVTDHDLFEDTVKFSNRNSKSSGTATPRLLHKFGHFGDTAKPSLQRLKPYRSTNLPASMKYAENRLEGIRLDLQSGTLFLSTSSSNTRLINRKVDTSAFTGDMPMAPDLYRFSVLIPIFCTFSPK